MKKPLYRKFLFSYLVLGIISFSVIGALGSYLIERHMEQSISKTLYREAQFIADNDTIKNDITPANLENVRKSLETIATYQNAVIWIINNKGDIVLSTRTDIPPDTPIDFKNFNPMDWGNNYYQVGHFYGYFPEQRMSVMAPITEDMTTKGYVAIHYLMTDLYKDRGRIIFIVQMLFLAMYILTFGLLLVFRKYVHKPLKQIIRGSSEYANGNLSYKIEVNSQDEMGQLASILNYMAEKINEQGEYQRNFISNVSHDFRSPLTSIKGYVEAMLDGTIPQEMQGRYLKIIAFEAERLEKLTSSLLKLNELDIKKRMLQIRKFDINEVIKTTAASFEGTCIERRLTLELILYGKELYVQADMEQIQQVLYNLLDNAIKFSPDGSSVTVETTDRNGRIFVSVKDRGCGIPKNSISKIWDRFYKDDSSRGKDRKGTGLGLAIVREIINAHHQNINVVSTEGVGTEFIFTLEKGK